MAQKRRNRLPDGRKISRVGENQLAQRSQSWTGLIIVGLFIAGLVIYGLTHS